MKTSMKIGSLIGIPIKIHFTFLIILALFAYVFTIEHINFAGFPIGFGDLPVSLPLKAALGIILTILFFSCVLLHELGHSYVTQKNGYNINGITLFIFGGSSELEETPREPDLEMKIAVVGPFVSLVLGGIFYALFRIINFGPPNLSFQAGSILFGTLAFYNLLLAGFNLIPAFPIDGGRVLRAALAKRMDYRQATKTAANVGKGVAVAMAIFGIFFNFWLILIAIFIFFGATQEQRMTSYSEALKDTTIQDMMSREVPTIAPSTMVDQVIEKMKTAKTLAFPVVDESHQLKGMITLEKAKKITEEDRRSTQVEKIMDSKENIPLIQKDENPIQVLKTFAKTGNDALIVLDGQEYKGILFRDDMIRTLKMNQTK